MTNLVIETPHNATNIGTETGADVHIHDNDGSAGDLL